MGDQIQATYTEALAVAVTPVAKTADKVEQQVMFVDAGAKGAGFVV